MTSPHTSFRRPLARPAVEGRRRPASRSGACALLATAQGLPPPSPSRPAPPVLPSVLVTPVYNLQRRSLAVPGSSWFLVSGERADSPLAPRGSVFRCLQQSSLRRRTQVPPPPVPSSAHLSRAPLLYRRGLPQVTSVFHVATSRGHPSVPIFLSFQSHSLPLKTVFSLDLGDAPRSTWPASCTLTSRRLDSNRSVFLSPPFFPRWARPASWCLCS